MSLLMKDVTKRYGTFKALDNVNIEFKENEIVGLIGFNGSGKTTSFNIITHLIENFDGDILVKENEEYRKIEQKDRIHFSYLPAGAEPQNSERVIDQLNYIGSLHGLSKKETMAQIQPAIEVLEFEDKLLKPIKSLSKGNQQKIKLAAVFINPHSKYIFLDEPFDGLDPIMVERIKNYILSQRQGKTIVITSHRMDVVDQMCDSFFILKEGKVAESKTTDNIKDETVKLVVNKEVPITFIKKIPGVIEVFQNPKETVLTIQNIETFKKVNLELIKNEKYIWSSYREKKLTESVFERYANG